MYLIIKIIFTEMKKNEKKIQKKIEIRTAIFGHYEL